MTSSKGKIKLVTDAGLPVGVAMMKDAKGKPVLGFDPGFNTTAKMLIKAQEKLEAGRRYSAELYWYSDVQLTDWQKGYLGSTTGRYSGSNRFMYNMPRGYGKTAMASSWGTDGWANFRNAMLKLNGATEKVTTGLEKLREANDEWEAKLKAALSQAKAEISEEKVAEFMEQYYLPYDYARNLLEEAYKDSILNGRKETNDTTESPA